MLDTEKVRLYLDVAKIHAYYSKAFRKRVGACVVTTSGVILAGINGTPSGTSNRCEDENNNTLQEVLHAELNCILKAAKEGVSIQGASLYVTLSPCIQCAAMIKQSGIKEVYYLEKYRCTKGIEYLEKTDVNIQQFIDF